jgi:DNA-binding CsgD family transcriptional regulator
VLLGRPRECAVLDDLVETVRGGSGRVLVLRGAAGVGKSALLDQLPAMATGLHVLRVVGVPSERTLAYAALHRLCGSLLDRVEQLPAPQGAALGTAFGLRSGTPPDRLHVALAVLGLLAAAAEERPVLCVIDDVQWLDPPSVEIIAFVARRLERRPVGVVLAVRDDDMVQDLEGLPELVVPGLPTTDARALLRSVIRGPLDARVLDRIVAEAEGNPLALLELRATVPEADLAGGYGPAASAMPQPLQESYLQRLAVLPAEVRRLLLIVAAEPTGDVLLVWRAAERLGVRLRNGHLALAADLVDLDGTARFRDPLARGVVYHAAAAEARRETHRALAEETDGERDVELWAWHLAHACDTPDAAVADELERSAALARARGGLAAAGAFLERAAALTPDPDVRATRVLAAAEAKHLAGADEAATDLLAAAEDGPLDGLRRAEADRLRGRIAFAASESGAAPGILLAAAESFARIDAPMAATVYLEALTAALLTGSHARRGSLTEVAESVLADARFSGGRTSEELLLQGLAVIATEGHRRGLPLLADALTALRADDVPSHHRLGWLWLACHAAGLAWDLESWERLSTGFARAAREAGALAVLPLALTNRAWVLINAGQLVEAASLLAEVRSMAELVPVRSMPYGAMALAAVRGDRDAALEVMDTALPGMLERGEAFGPACMRSATALLYNGLGRYEDAAVAAEQASPRPPVLWSPTWASIELVEACARLGDRARAVEALDRVVKATATSGSDWGLGLERLSRALLAEGDEAERLYAEAIERLGRTGARFRLARARLLYGEWLRRERRRRDARDELRAAHDAFSAMGAEAFSERAARELQATGVTARKRSTDTGDQLTPREAQVAALARDGLTNMEIGNQLFLSPRTVEYHLAKVFAKLSITSRNELDVALSAIDDGAHAKALGQRQA